MGQDRRPTFFGKNRPEKTLNPSTPETLIDPKSAITYEAAAALIRTVTTATAQRRSADTFDLLGHILATGGAEAAALESHGINHQVVLEQMQQIPFKRPPERNPNFTPELRKTVKAAIELAHQFGSGVLALTHLTAALAESNGHAGSLIKARAPEFPGHIKALVASRTA